MVQLRARVLCELPVGRRRRRRGNRHPSGRCGRVVRLAGVGARVLIDARVGWTVSGGQLLHRSAVFC
jgi:hypothetical protein